MKRAIIYIFERSIFRIACTFVTIKEIIRTIVKEIRAGIILNMTVIPDFSCCKKMIMIDRLKVRSHFPVPVIYNGNGSTCVWCLVDQFKAEDYGIIFILHPCKNICSVQNGVDIKFIPVFDWIICKEIIMLVWLLTTRVKLPCVITSSLITRGHYHQPRCSQTLVPWEITRSEWQSMRLHTEVSQIHLMQRSSQLGFFLYILLCHKVSGINPVYLSTNYLKWLDLERY